MGLPKYLTDAPTNAFIVSLLEDARSDTDDVFHRIANAQLELAIAQTKAFFPEQYAERNGHGDASATASSAPAWGQ